MLSKPDKNTKMHAPGAFVLHGGDVAFANRQKLLFDKLSVAEEQCTRNHVNNSQDMETESEPKSRMPISRDRMRRRETIKFRGRESIFKRPEGPAPRANFRSIPDHHRNPHKWTKYSLDDVSTEDMTDQSNTQAALSFLNELKKWKKTQLNNFPEEMDIDSPQLNNSGNVKISFKSKKIKSCSNVQFEKPECDIQETNKSPVVVDVDDKPVFKSSKVVMPEYVVGQKQKKKEKIRQPKIKIDRTKQMKLSHLEEPDDIET